MSYENKHLLRDGRIVLYTRNNRPTFHVRLKIEGNKGYIIKSTKRNTLAEAVIRSKGESLWLASSSDTTPIGLQSRF